MTTSRGIPSSRAYWELKADQMMNRIFDPEGPIDLEDSAPLPPEAAAAQGRPAGAPASAAGAAAGAGAVPANGPAQRSGGLQSAPAAARARSAAAAAAPAGPIRTVRSLGRERPAMLLSALGGIGLASLITSLLYLNHANQVQQSLRQERNLLLVERLRSLGPASPAAAAPAVAPAAAAISAGGEELPPPPDEPWAEQLSQLPRGEAGGAAPLRVSTLPAVVNAPSSAGADRDTPAPAAPSAAVPQLVGVVGAPGKAGSAIFQVGGSSSNVSAGETIGGSGWRLRSADGDTALIERGGEVRRVAISGGF